MNEPSTSRSNKRKASLANTSKQKRTLTDAELQEEAEKYMAEGSSDESFHDFSDSGSEWNDEEESKTDTESGDISDDDGMLDDAVVDDENDNTSDSPTIQDVISNEWLEVDCSHLRFDIQFTGKAWYNNHVGEYPENKNDLTPYHVYSKFFDDEILDVITLETNRNAEQQKNKKVYTRYARINKWKPTNNDEMRKFFGIVMYMGLVKCPRISDYWNLNILYQNQVIPKIMSRNRFQLLLRYVHFANNDTVKADRLYKIRNVYNMMQRKFSENAVPGETIVVDESMVPFRGRLLFRQYIPSKRHRYGIKIFKLCDTIGYTYRMSLYTGQTFLDGSQGLGEKIVLDLCENYLSKGRTVVTDNYYTSIPLAVKLLENNKHLLGTLRKNRKGLPDEVIKAKINKGEIVGKENSDGFVVAKWKDRREVTFLSTKHGIDQKTTGKKIEKVRK